MFHTSYSNGNKCDPLTEVIPRLVFPIELSLLVTLGTFSIGAMGPVSYSAIVYRLRHLILEMARCC